MGERPAFVDLRLRWISSHRGLRRATMAPSRMRALKSVAPCLAVRRRAHMTRTPDVAQIGTGLVR
jgi:hypothetical protein